MQNLKVIVLDRMAIEKTLDIKWFSQKIYIFYLCAHRHNTTLPMPALKRRQENLLSVPGGVVKTWWLKANVRSYVVLSSAIREDYCRCLDFMKDRVKGKNCNKMDSQGSMTETIRSGFRWQDTCQNWKVKSKNTFL